MSAKNGGRGEPPVPPEGHGPPPEAMEIPISKEIIQPSKMTTAQKDEDGRLHVSFVTVESGVAVQYTWIVEENGQKNITDAITGGVQIADLSDLKKLKDEHVESK